MKNLWKVCAGMCAGLLMIAAFYGCGREKDEPKDPRQAFVGDYTFVSTGDIDLYMGAVKIISVPMNKEGELSIALAEKSNEVWMISENDTAVAYVSGDILLMNPTNDTTTIGGVEMQMSYTYGKATLVDNQLSLPMNVDITATYKSVNIKGTGTVEIVATKKNN